MRAPFCTKDSASFLDDRDTRRGAVSRTISNTTLSKPGLDTLESKIILIRYGGWLPSSKEAYNSFFSQLTDKISDHRAKALPHIPAVAAFAKAMNASFSLDPKMIDLWDQIFVQAAPQNEIKESDSLLRSLDILLFNPRASLFHGIPMAILSGNPSAYGAIIRSQSWLTQSATRVIICIQADNPKIGLVGFIGVGMAEVSTCAF
ncbi:hypothetical protein B0H14DRAFT_3555790 [Mycena olivaceomarginata]|nr:hypothetical protein B0H14DRAFT_3555790 [Mycena olivaceomarginata]